MRTRPDGLWLVVTLSCYEVLVVVQCYVDCECDCDTALEVAAHLEACPGCDAEVVTIRWLKAAVRRCAGASESRVWLSFPTRNA
jgi:hypothetical protein